MKIEAPTKIIPAFNNLKTNAFDIVVMEGGRGGAKSEALAALGNINTTGTGIRITVLILHKQIKDH